MSLRVGRLSSLCSTYSPLTCVVFRRFLCSGMSNMLILNENASDPIGDSYVQIIGNGSRGIAECALVRVRDTRVLFNCGENSDSLFRGRVNHVFITHLDWAKIGGILALIYKASSSNREQLSLFGPPGLDIFMRASERFTQTLHNFQVKLMDCNSLSDIAFSSFGIICVPIKNRNSKPYKPPFIDKSCIKDPFLFKDFEHTMLNRQPLKKIDLNVSYSYICKSGSSKAWALSECVKRGVKPGENMQKLWRGESILLENGTVVQPNDVIITKLCSNVIVLDCPTRGYLDDLLRKEEYEAFYKAKPLTIIHFTPVDVMLDKKYISWMQRFSRETKHVIVNQSNELVPPWKAINRQEVCRLISPRFFPKLRVPEEYHSDQTPHWVQFDDFFINDKNPAAIIEETISQNWLKKWRPIPKDLQLVQSWAGTFINLNDLNVLRTYEPFVITQIPHQDEANFKIPPRFSSENPRITFLGTCSQGNATYRSSSAILIQTSLEKSMLLDCGDGTLHQIASLYNQLDFQRLLTSIRCIYISHTHADHHSGLVGVLLSISKAWKLSGQTPRKIILFLPPPLLDWVETYNNKFQPILEHVIPISLNDLISDTKHRDVLRKLYLEKLDFEKIGVCWAKHSPYSYCVSFEHISGWKISYSGDSKYNKFFVRIGKDSDLLIHEATYASGLDSMASRTRHSTTEEAIRAGREMNAKQIILTHFSKRYPVVPALKDLRNTSNVSIAFDFLQVNLNDIHYLPKLNESYEVVFEQHLTSVDEEHARLLSRQLILNEQSVESVAAEE